jgi:hypothetical protein
VGVAGIRIGNGALKNPAEEELKTYMLIRGSGIHFSVNATVHYSTGWPLQISGIAFARPPRAILWPKSENTILRPRQK